jgi:rhodanese-related sulfurtransferase
METYQIIILSIILLIIILRIKKKYSTRSINNYSADQVKQKLKNKERVIIIDVRTGQERKSGYINPSIHIPLHELESKIDQLKKFQSNEIICYCHSGHRSISAAMKLKKLGFNSSNMKGGYLTW